jgi:branched-chain amino acid transport system permease protein
MAMEFTNIKLKKSTKLILTVLLVIACLILTYMLDKGIIGTSYTIRIVRIAVIYSLIGVSMNLVNGFTGVFSLGQAGFMAIGAYSVGIFTIPLEARANVYYLMPISDKIANVVLPFGVALLLGGILAALFAALIGAPVLKLKSDYLAIATLGFSEIVRAVIANEQLWPITNGSLGLKSIPGFTTLFAPVLISAAGITLMVLLIKSSYGRAFKAIREDETAAESMGINLFKHKELSFVVSAFFAGIGGGLLATHLTAIDSNQFKIAVTYELLLIIVLGGLGSVTGTVLSAFMISFGKEYLRFFDAAQSIGGWQIPIFRPGLRMVIFSLLLMAVVLFWRKGLMGRKEFSWDGIYNFLRKWPWRLKKLLRGEYKIEAKAKRDSVAVGKAIDSAASKSKRAGIKADKTADREKKRGVKADAK